MANLTAGLSHQSLDSDRCGVWKQNSVRPKHFDGLACGNGLNETTSVVVNQRLAKPALW